VRFEELRAISGDNCESWCEMSEKFGGLILKYVRMEVSPLIKHSECLKIPVLEWGDFRFIDLKLGKGEVCPYRSAPA
jgi:hypothetical protein